MMLENMEKLQWVSIIVTKGKRGIRFIINHHKNQAIFQKFLKG
jgi:hypothetical protein